ncbi:Uncharacterized protein QJS10_CPA01g00164 [Acorus calamus]|uniref:Cgi-62 n=1 Tax=Acorus calamus TaxID=4465 RepID=A0AAV9FJE7_ACOCL|nr:Uncharacterized protein QJS10_CPA01g00164 [Acorus calamus]
MGSRVPVQHYNLRSAATTFIGGSLHDLNEAEARAAAEIEGMGGGDVGRGTVGEVSLDRDDDDESNSVDDCIHGSYRNSLPLHGVGVDDDRSSLENSGSSRSPYNLFTAEDLSPIETARARFLEIFVDHFINDHVIEVVDSSDTDYIGAQEKLNKRRPREVQYEGDPRFVLPLMYVANLYETLVGDVNMRLASLDGSRDKTIGVALEAAGGLYRKLAKKFPRKGACTFKRRELATSLETRTRFPELVVHEEKRVRFVVVNGLVIVEKPNTMNIDDAEWFKRLTGRHEVAISARDYKFYSPRHKYRRTPTQSISNIPGLPAFSGRDSSPLSDSPGFRPVNEPRNQQQASPKHHMEQLSHQPQFHHMQQMHHQPMQQGQHPSPFTPCPHSSHLQEIPHSHQSPTMSQHIPCMPHLTGCHVGGRLHLLPTGPAKFCDECGAPYLRETSKFCSECGVKRLGT